MKKVTTWVGAAVLLAVTGCGSMSGLDAKSDFACKAPDGVLCESMSGIYANAMANNLPGQRVNHGGEVSPAKAPQSGTGVLTKPVYSGTPIRSAPLVLRVWFAPWEDSDGDLHDQAYVYLTVDSGKWLIEHNRRRIQDAFRPVRAPAQQAPQAGSNQGPATGGRIRPAQQVPASVNDDPAPTPQSAQEILNGLLKAGVPGSPAEPRAE